MSTRSLVTEELYCQAKEDLKKYGRECREGVRLQAIMSAKRHGVCYTAKAFGRDRSTIRYWIKKYLDKNSLTYSPGRGGKPILQQQHMRAIESWLASNPCLTLKELIAKLAQDFELVIKKSALHRHIKKQGFSYITPRPKHYKQKQEDVLEFQKKNLSIDATVTRKRVFLF